MTRKTQFEPGTKAPATATYELLNAFGTPSGTRQQIAEGAKMPAAPLHWTWRRCPEPRQGPGDQPIGSEFAGDTDLGAQPAAQATRSRAMRGPSREPAEGLTIRAGGSGQAGCSRR
jgi:hypothetical protein